RGLDLHPWKRSCSIPGHVALGWMVWHAGRLCLGHGPLLESCIAQFPWRLVFVRGLEEKLRPLLPFLIMTSLVTSVVIFPIGYQDNYEVVRTVASFNLSSDSSSLYSSKNVNFDSDKYTQIGANLSIEA